MSALHEQPRGNLSPGWRYATVGIVLCGFAVLFWMAGRTYRYAPPIPQRVADEQGHVLFTGDDVIAGQQVFMKHGLMEHGSLWGHGAYLGPDFSAEYLHQLAMDAANDAAEHTFGRPLQALTPVERQAVGGEVHRRLTENRYDPATRVLRFLPFEAVSFRDQIRRWAAYFTAPHSPTGLPAGSITDPAEIRHLTAFFAWAAWACVANAPGKNYSYTNNFPYDPAVGNGPSGSAVLWSALSLIALLGGIATVLFAFGSFHYLGWRRHPEHLHPELLPGRGGSCQLATLPFFLVAALLFLEQTCAGGALAHFRVQPGSFYGIDISHHFSGPLLRTWHLQLAILWIATAYVAGGLLLMTTWGRAQPRSQLVLIRVLFWALVVVVVGSLAGEWWGLAQRAGRLWFWFGHQGWEYLELGRAWQVLLAIGLALWLAILVRGVWPVTRDPEQRELAILFLLSAGTIPFFYLPAFFFGPDAHFTVVDMWRFWIIHLWVEGFFELFATVMVAVTFYKLGMVSRLTAARACSAS